MRGLCRAAGFEHHKYISHRREIGETARAFHEDNYETPDGICISYKLDMEIARCLVKRSCVQSRRSDADARSFMNAAAPTCVQSPTIIRESSNTCVALPVSVCKIYFSSHPSLCLATSRNSTRYTAHLSLNATHKRRICNMRRIGIRITARRAGCFPRIIREN